MTNPYQKQLQDDAYRIGLIVGGLLGFTAGMGVGIVMGMVIL